MASIAGRLLPDRIRSSYVTKFGLVVLLVLVATVGAAVFFYVDITDDLTTNVHAEMEQTAVGDADALGEWVDYHEQMTLMLSSYDELVTGTDEEIDDTLDAERRGMSDAHAIHYIDLETDEVIHSTDEAALGTDITDLDLELHRGSAAGAVTEFTYEGELNVQVSYSDAYERDGAEYVAFLSPVDGTDDRAVMVEVDATDLPERFSDPIEGSYTQVVDAADGDVMSASDGDLILSPYRDGADENVLDTATADATAITGSAAYDDDGLAVGYAYVPGTDWLLVSHAPQEEAYAITDDVVTSLAGLIAIALAGFVVIGATIGRSTARAMDDLADNALTLSDGQTDLEIADDGRIDEVGQVRESFDGIRQYLETAANQADAIARQEFDAPVLKKDVPGKLGDSLETMRTDLETYIDDVETSREEAEAAQAEAAEARHEAEALAESLERKAGEFGQVMTEAAEGDFTQRLDEDVDNEALAEIARAFNGMLEDLERTIVDIQALAEDVDRISTDVTDRVAQIEQASDEVSRSTEEISTATADQNERFQTVYGEMNELSATVEEIASTADDVASVSDRAAEQAHVAGEATSEIRAEMANLEQRAEEITTQVAQLDAEMGEISEIVDLIDDIAEQTNLLALNASIEAASAAEGGDGFAVVASEVKSLAEETGEATQEVDALIGEVQGSVDETVAEIDRMREQVDDGVTVVDKGIEAIDAITEQVDRANDGVQSINEATDEQARASERVVTMVDEATDRSEETNAETETVAAAVEEQTASIADVATGAHSLTEMADDLRVSLDAFEVDASASSADSDGVLPSGESRGSATDEVELEYVGDSVADAAADDLPSVADEAADATDADK
ncbi:methyl-accepting chemotaxis protein [Natrarchaeobaculum sulfurireducens]|uniref:Methyl-accepting chemotaxis protein n=1 Tax=Natrarchaeobaculum sulfurireducens TaxID=2044521 RepID=A0A346PJA5_9EURY|nr:methyl-accepting chemotaxis protein [Natrarchaeobaculum sulfurireducens]AXR79600.1 Methyl-accepting chemotaxis protein [Natrarchaeobaculum sulfurireducens]